MSFIPEYPRFVNINHTHKALIDDYSKIYPDYCTYTFGGLYNWSPKSKPTELSVLNGNLIVRTQEFLTDNSNYVFFIGNKNLLKTVETLLRDYKKIDLVPNSISSKLSKNFKIIEDSRNNNYIFSTKKIHYLEGKSYRDKKRQIKKFLNLYKNLEIKLIDTNQTKIRKQVLGVHEKWETKKGHVPIEKEATINYLYNKYIKKMDLGIYLYDKLVAYTLNDISNPNMVMGNFAKADKEFKYLGTIYEYFTSSILYLSGYNFINLEMDSGLENFAKEKLSWKPITILKMYVVKS